MELRPMWVPVCDFRRGGGDLCRYCDGTEATWDGCVASGGGGTCADATGPGA